MPLSKLYKQRNKIIPKLASLTRDALHRSGIPISKNELRIRKLRGIHAGQRAFILGNGPSLKIADLDRLKGEICFASNKIYLAFEQTEWRPTYYSVFDKLVAKNNAAVIQKLELTKLFSDHVMEYLGDDQNAIWLRETYDNGVWLEQADRGESLTGGVFSRNCLLEVASGWTVVYAQLQLAFYLGITEVILLGVDYNFDVPKTTVKTKEHGYETALESRGEQNHFHPDYRKPGEIWAVPRLDMQFRAFQLANEVYRSSGRRVINASRTTKLDVFPRGECEQYLKTI